MTDKEIRELTDLLDKFIKEYPKDGKINEYFSTKGIRKIKLEDLTLGDIRACEKHGCGILAKNVCEEYEDILHQSWLGCIEAILQNQDLDKEAIIY